MEAVLFRLKIVGSPAIGLMAGLAACMAVLCCGSAWALGTPAGTVIAGTASVSYTLGADPTVHTVSASHSFAVLEVIDVTATWQDSGPVPVNTPHAGGVLTFLLTNTGNGPEAFELSAEGAVSGDDFDPAVQAIWLEVNGSQGLQTTGATPDIVYQPGLNDPDLPADGDIRVYVISDIPPDLSDGAAGQVRLQAAATTAGAAGAPAGTELPGAGLNGVAAIVGLSRADANALGSYAVAGINVSLTKSIHRITDPFGGSEPFPGAQVTYRIIVDVAGSGTAEGLIITDPVPADTTYVPGSIVLDGAAQTDAADAPVDNSDFDVTGPNTVTVNIGDTVAPATHTIEFTTIID